MYVIYSHGFSEKRTQGQRKVSNVVKANYKSGIDSYEGIGVRTVPPSPTATAGIFCTYPQVWLTYLIFYVIPNLSRRS